MKIGFFGSLEADKKNFYQTTLAGHQLEFIDQELTEQSLPAVTDFEAIAIFVESKITQPVLIHFPNLKFIAIRATGFDNVDLQFAKQKNILVANVPSYGSHTVAEFAFGLILSLSRNIPQAIFKLKTEQKFDHQGLRGIDLFDKTLGVIGTGKIGANVIKIGQGLGMKILAHDAYPNDKLSQELNFNYVSLEELLKNSDVVTLHCPATPETNHLINQSNIGLMKKSAFLINTARGSIIETAALLTALKNNQIAGAAVDVFEKEDQLTGQEKELLDLKNCLVTPHTAFYTTEAEQAIMETTAENIKAFISGSPTNIVSK